MFDNYTFISVSQDALRTANHMQHMLPDEIIKNILIAWNLHGFYIGIETSFLQNAIQPMAQEIPKTLADVAEKEGELDQDAKLSRCIHNTTIREIHKTYSLDGKERLAIVKFAIMTLDHETAEPFFIG